tara:strand:- start:408 stop:713 length:306 start_codon:yes stop_codon:yes gene_type:complete
VKTGIESCSWNAVDVLNVVDGAELVTVVRDVYLCVWHGGNVVEIHDIREGRIDPDHQVLPMWAERTLLTVHDAIDDYFIQFDADNEQNDLTTAPIRVIVES